MTDFSLIEIVYTAILSRDLIVSNQRLLVGVSGGTDSLALLHILVQLRARIPFDLHVATLDHVLRGEAGAADARFVVEMAQTWGVAITAGYSDVKMLAQEKGIGIEAAARVARYDFLASVAREVGAERIAVAHNADDQAETILLHLLRGAGLSGLVGMRESAPLPGHPDLTLIRPLLGVPRDELAAYCVEHGLQPRHDASNDDVTYTRNRLRRDIIPQLREISPRLERRLRQLGEIASLEDDLVAITLHAATDPYITRTDARISLPKDVFFGLHPALQQRFVVWAVSILGEDREIDFRRVQAAVELAFRGKVGARAQFRSGVQLRLEYQTIVVERADVPLTDELPLLNENVVIPVAIPGATPVNTNWSLQATLTPLEGETARLAIAEGSEVALRGRRRGDRFLAINLYGAPTLGLSGHTKKLNEWMIDHKVPRHLRERLPLLVIRDEIAAVWWHGWTVSQRFAAVDLSPRVIYFRLSMDIVMESEKEVR